MKKSLIWIGALVVLIAAFAGYRLWKKREAAPVWITAPVTRDGIHVTVTATGTLKAVTTVEVGTQVSGTIAALYADFNSHVKKDQIIARLDTTLLYAALQDARSNLERVAALDQQASAEQKRSRTLFGRELISQSELDQAVANARVASANLISARAGVDRAKINLRYAIIRSPIDGIVLSRAVELGQTVAASFSTPTLFSLAGDLREMNVQAAVDEADIGKVKEGQSASFTVDAYPDEVFTGKVEQVRLQPTVTANVVTYDVVLKVPNDDLRLMPGMTANLTIVVAAHDSVLTVPARALQFVPPRPAKAKKGFMGTGPKGAAADSTFKKHHRGPGDGPRDPNRGRIFLLVDGKPKFVPVTMGLTDGARTEISGDIEEGSLVITGAESMDKSSASKPGTPFGMSAGRPGGGGGGGGGGRRN